jgi:hypothetical protein
VTGTESGGVRALTITGTAMKNNRLVPLALFALVLLSACAPHTL